MKRLFLFILFINLILSSFADGWRENEKEVRVFINNPAQAELLRNLRLNVDFYGDQARVFVIPEELSRLTASGLNYEVLINDLNAHFKDFWTREDAYHTYAQIIALADSLDTYCPSIVEKFVLGQSIQGRQLAALKISDNPAVDENEAEIHFDGGIHGDEIGGSENVIRFARQLCQQYNAGDPYVTSLVNNREIWLYLMVNPDGRESMSRYNANGVDVNRDWGYMWNEEGGSSGPYSQIETKVLRNYEINNQFVINTSYHSGTEFISYPWSYRPDACPDQAHTHTLAQLYSTTSGYSNLPYGQGYSGMYPINGSSKDFNYAVPGSVSWSLEISMDKQPPASQIMYYFNLNSMAMKKLVEYAGYGIQGVVTDASTGQPVQAIIKVNNFYPCYTDPVVGDYHKYLNQGNYSIKVMANGYQTQTINNVVVTSLNVTTVDVQLTPQPGQSAYRVITCEIPNNNFSDEGNTSTSLGMPDNINYSLGKSGYIVLDMQYPVVDGPGPDIEVFEGDATAEGFKCYAGTTMDGPWVFLSNGTGTAQIDLADGNVSEARYFKILDDGDGASTGADIGYDLDAIVVMEQTSGVYLALYESHVEDPQGNNNGKLDPGETAGIMVTLKNNGDIVAENVQGTLSTSSQYITINQGTAAFGSIAHLETSEGSFSVTPAGNTPVGQTVNFTLNVTSNSGSYTNSFTLTYVVGQIPVIIIDLDGNHNSGPVMQSAMAQLGVPAEYTTSFPSDLSIYSSAFVCLGIYSSNHVLTSSEGQALAAMLNAGGSLYMEGGDTWYYDTQTAAHEMFNINATGDGSSDLGTLQGQTGTFTEGMSFTYSGDNNWIDRLEAITPATMVLKNQTPSYGTAVAHDGGSFKTIGASHEFGGLQNSGSSTTLALMQAYLEFLGLLQTGVTANFSANNTQTCTGSTVQFTDNSTGAGINSWQWTFEGGNPATSNLQNPAVVYNTPGDYDVTLTVSNGTSSNTYGALDYILVMPAPGITEIPTGPAELCENAANTSYTTSGAAYATSYNWTLTPAAAGTITGSGNIISIDWNNTFSGIATLHVTGVNMCGSGTTSPELTINISPLPAAAGSVSGDNYVCWNEITNYTVPEITHADNYEWVLIPNEAGIPSPSMNSVNIIWSDDFEGSAQLKVRGVNDCGAGNYSAEFQITVANCTGIAKTEIQPWFTIQPNPSHDQFSIAYTGAEQQAFKLRLTDITGKALFLSEDLMVNGSSTKTYYHTLENGVYLLIISNEFSHFVKKLVVN